MSAEVVLVVRRRGGIYQLDVVTAGDYKHWTVNLPPTRKIKDHSCLDDNQFCDVVSVTPLESGFIVMDRHRVLEFQFTWQPDDNYRLVRHIGQMNAVNTEATYGSLHFPSAAALYQPLNATHIDEEIAITPLFPDARGRFLFVTDTGNHRVVMLNCSSAGQLAYIGQFGITGEARHNSTGLDSPWGIAVYAPAWESFFQPVFANVFVVDRRNSRLVKLDLGYRGSQPPEEDELPRLAYSGDYRSGATVSETLVDPTGVALYRHYVLVAEARGNAILVLVVDHQTTTRMRFVTHLRPARGVQLTGSIAASPLAYVWFSYITSPNDYGLGSLFLHEALRWSFKPSRLADLIDTCQNSTWYDVVLRFNRTMYMDFVGSALGAARINWMFPSMPGYVDVQSFNRTADFNLDAFNRTVFQGRMTLCQPPPPPPPPSMLSGNSDGWKMENRMSPAQADARRLYACTCWWILLQWVCCGLSLWPL